MKHIAYIGLGSNLGDREGNIRAAIDGLIADVTSGAGTISEWGGRD
ncbi:MAG: hypothetical protein ACYTF1_11110 [Planctomycetota bacterium]|jgi:7,8-dihydro-6-hydroxymethylpterin-pyrophosphokinase